MRNERDPHRKSIGMISLYASTLEDHGICGDDVSLQPSQHLLSSCCRADPSTTLIACPSFMIHWPHSIKCVGTHRGKPISGKGDGSVWPPPLMIATIEYSCGL
eukprot:Blabericola_migrator_1__5433@NODE_2779_length_2364_cov_191_018720_g1741_i0_p3_GENE_NODE_2779_length_2364_cov_191_018720_g1741_i0NODE_2779_length_2364_cov_191_018720_g1741_i0_p3_ORF_typecomplete_len103_score9_99DUF2456/PF10445_9/0_075_NODE_2779_length_2364_cov_191_018720_g1741_i0600908